MPFFNFRNKKIFYRREGKGKRVLLVHGFAEDGNLWNQQVDSLKEKNLVIIPDLPGSGSSEMLDWKASIEDFAEVLKALTDEINLTTKEENEGTFCMIGHSMGGYITLAFAEKYPQLLNSLGLFHSSAFADSAEKVMIRNKGIEFIRKNGTDAFLKTSVPNLFFEETKKEKPQLSTELFNIGKNISPETLIQYYEAMIERPDRTNVLKKFSKPVLFIAGKNDTAVPLPASLEQMSMPPISVMHILQRSGHMGMWEQVQLSNSYLNNFLNELN
jgi:pimeloyl-ACP methyl ester carboxylesterase